MNITKRKVVISMILLTILIAIPKVYAKTSIEIKPNSSVVYTNKTISDFFDESLAMKAPGEGLEGLNLDVHMAKNTEWAIVSYFSNSAYGTNGEGQNDGVTVSINGQDYLSTNGNATGVMDFGKTGTYTSGIISNYTDIVDNEEEEEPYDWGKSIIEYVNNNVNNTLVDLISYKDDYKVSAAARKWYGATVQVSSGSVQSTWAPYSTRRGLFGIQAGSHTNLAGMAKPFGNEPNITFRPIIWN